MAEILGERDYYKPFRYEWAFDWYKIHQAMHWVPEDIALGQDAQDWATKLTDEERHLLTQVFRLFTQTDADVAGAYAVSYLPFFGHPEVRMMLFGFGERETVHIDSYSLFIETVGMPESQYQVFQQYASMVEKHEYITQDRPLLEAIVAKSVFGEGLLLFGSFAMLMAFPKRGLMPGMGTVVEYSIRDETAHVAGMVDVWHVLKSELGAEVPLDLEQRVRDIATSAVSCEDAFIDLAFEMGPVEGITAEEVKAYIRYIADLRMKQLDYGPIFGQKENPLPWIDEMVRMPAHTNFFEKRSTEYAKGRMQGDWTDAYSGA